MSDRALLAQRETLADTTRRQGQASDPSACAWVSANAGTGKTHVLTQRVLRLLLTGAPPERILCLTYTKAAAAEMSRRVFDTLAGWVGLDDAALHGVLLKLLERKATSREHDLARTLFARAIETPGGFKVQTIHAFCERLLKRFPLEAGVSPGFEILDDRMTSHLLSTAIDDMLTAATTHDTVLGHALKTAIRYAVDESFDRLLATAIKQRSFLARLHARASADETDAITVARGLLCKALSVGPDATATGTIAEMANVLDTPTLQRLVIALAAGGKEDLKFADTLRQAIAVSGKARAETLSTYFLTTDREMRKRLMSKAVCEEHPSLHRAVSDACERIYRLDRELAALEVIEATLALYRLADAVRGRYEDGKVARGMLDFDDLIGRTASLLAERESAAWVLHKLDGGLDHILLDEAQDTAPPQWSVVERLAGDFFADIGIGGREVARTIFAVGDEKQSIYSFQGAAPHMFADAGRRFQGAAKARGVTFHETSLTLSFRSVTPVLAAVDTVFADPTATPGLTTVTSAALAHAVHRLGHGGLVELWPVEQPDPKSDTDAWSPLDEVAPTSPVSRLADRIARTIHGWIETGETLASTGRPIKAGDVLILLRKREPLASAIVTALKAYGVPVAGADRIMLTEQIVVQDLLALGDFLTLPEDDLSLAAVLKSPLFDFNDDHLLDLACERPSTLWRALLAVAPRTQVYTDACARLKTWRKSADFLPPFEFFSSVLDHEGGRMAFLERLGEQAGDALDEFLDLALHYGDQNPPSLVGFLAWVRGGDSEIKRDMEQARDEVRVITVHGSKGLEAPIVVLPDTCGANSGNASKQPLLTLVDTNLGPLWDDLFVWKTKGSKGLSALDRAKEDSARAQTHEGNRLLYVAMTRARDRLYIAGVQGRQALSDDCWYETITRALAPAMAAAVTAHGEVLRFEQPHTAERTSVATKASSIDSPTPTVRPSWLTTPAPRETRLVLPPVAARFLPYDYDEDGDPIDLHRPTIVRVGSKSKDRDTLRFLQGTLTHSLLEHLPQLPLPQRQEAAHAFVATRAAELTPEVRARIVAQTLAIMSDVGLAPLFGSGSLAEVPIVARLTRPSGRGAPLMLHGRIDRLIETGSEVIVLDYKTNATVPKTVEDVPAAYLLQLAGYRKALKAVFPDKPIRAILLWTHGPQRMDIPNVVLDDYGSRLWD